ncbi:MAG: ABC transporter ATP-binding protein [candidate division Zixibacteria bacterium]|nr:ABC transporter ATP-binding protein [candidate division Zixibacteria bacterium]
MNIVETFDLTKIYQTGMKKGNVVALDGVSLGVEHGEIFGLLGPNGAGKTTMVKSLLGITRVSSGEALINGLPPSDPRSRDRVGFLPENHRFPNHLTGMGLLEFTGRLYGMKPQDIRTRAESLLRLVDMDKWGGTKIRKYSKGMSQRIGLAQAMICDPDLIFLDEPTDGVDPVGKIEIRETLKRIKSEGKTIFLNSHLLSEVEAVADRVTILLKGKVVKTGSVESLTTRKSQYDIDADIGNERFVIPEEIGKRITITTKSLRVELNDPKFINRVIDELRLRNINIRAVQPVTMTLEQSFFEAVRSDSGEAS